MLNGRTSPAVAGAYLGGGILGALLSASVIFVASGFISPIAPAWRAWICMAGLAILLARAIGLVGFGLPQSQRQIAQEVFLDTSTKAAFRFAFELGTSVRTYITTEAPYAVFLVVLLLLPASLTEGALMAMGIAIGFGTGRAAIVSTQILRRDMVVEHPAWALHAANVIALTGAAGIALHVILD